MLSEEEIKEAIERLEYFEPEDLIECAMYRNCLEKVQGLLDLYNKEKNRLLIEGKFREIADKNSYIKDNYISKDKIKEKIEFYKRYGKIKNSDEYVMSVEIEILEELLGDK